MKRTLAVCCLVSALGAQDRPLTAREAEKLLPELIALDVRTPDGHARAQGLLERLRGVPLPSAREQKDWKKKFEKLWGKGRELERSGDNWFWGDEKKKEPRRGRYIVAGGDAKKPKGLLIAMHGGGVGSGDADSSIGAYQSAANAFGWVVIAPEVLEKTERGWTDSGTEEFVLDLVDAALRTWKLDPDKVLFVGHSMGGYGSWTLGGHHADRVAAIAPSAGAPTPIRSSANGPIVDVQEGVIPSLRNVFVSIYQSLDDVQVPPEPNQVAARLLADAAKKWGGFEHVYWEVNGRGHAEPPGGYGAQLDKVVTRVRKAVPERIVWQPALSWKRQFHWLYWDAPATHAIVVADLDRKANSVTITCDKPTDGLHVLLDARVVDLAREVVVTVNGAETFRGKVTPSLVTLLRTSDHPDPALQFVASAPAFGSPGR